MLCLSNFSLLFFFKQKTAYEMRISDWSSDVCSSDLTADISTRCARIYPAFDGARKGDTAVAGGIGGQRRHYSGLALSQLAADGDAAIATCIGGGRRTGRAGQAARAVAARQNLNRFAFAVRLAVRRAGLRRQATINYAGNGRAARLVGELVYRSIAVDAEIQRAVGIGISAGDIAAGVCRDGRGFVFDRGQIGRAHV